MPSGRGLPDRRTWLAVGLGGLAAGLTGGALGAWARTPADVRTDELGDQLQRLPRERLPVFAASPDHQRLYRFAVDRSDVLRYMPCFCGCGRFGHRDNRHCYVKADHADGTVTYTSHAAT
jgi:hypothetical protein